MKDLNSRSSWSTTDVLSNLGLVAGPAGLVGIIGAAIGWPNEYIARLALLTTVLALVFHFRDRVNKFASSTAIMLGLSLWFFISGSDNHSVDACLASAERLRKPYAIRSATYAVRLERATEGTIRQSRRMFYTVAAREKMSYVPKAPQFFEGFDSHHQDAKGGSIPSIRWPGSDDETEIHPPWQSYGVALNLAPGEQRTIVTGADFVVPYPFTASRTGKDSLILAANEDDFTYTNGTGENLGDALCELTIVIESSTLRLDSGGSKALRNKKDAMPQLHQEIANGRWSITARFPSMESQETAWLKFRLAE